MRLGQLSRKIGIQPSRISVFLEQQNFTLEAGSNSKLTEEQEELVKTHFDYVEEEDAKASDTPEVNAEAVDALQKEGVTTKTESIEGDEEISKSDTEEVIEEEVVAEIGKEESITELGSTTETTEDEVIRAPKLKLEGLKVIGKIDLPEPKIVTAVDSSETLGEEVKEKPIRKKLNNYKGNRRPQKRTLEEKREREERIKKRKRKEQKEKQKQLKAAHYESRMRELELTSPKKDKYKIITDDQQNIEKEVAPAPKSLFGKFMRWLNT